MAVTFVHVEDPYENEAMALSPAPANASPQSWSGGNALRKGEDELSLSPAIDSLGNPNMVSDESIPTDPGAFRAYLLWHFQQGPSQWYP